MTIVETVQVTEWTLVAHPYIPTLAVLPLHVHASAVLYSYHGTIECRATIQQNSPIYDSFWLIIYNYYSSS